VQPFVDDQEDGFDFGPIPNGLATPELGYVLGSTLGAAVAGAEPCQRRIERWQQLAVTDPAVTRLVARLQRAAAGQPTAPQLAAELARMYPAIAQGPRRPLLSPSVSGLGSEPPTSIASRR
jgi:hypothetical protein